MNQKVYLGDSVYASYDGYHVVLTTENSIEITNGICLDPDVLKLFLEYVEKLPPSRRTNG